MLRVKVPLGDRSYDVLVGAGAISELDAILPASAARVEPALGALMQAEMAPVGEAILCEAADHYQTVDWQDAAAVLRTVGADPQFAMMRQRSPTSLAAILASHQAARRLADIGEALALDLRLARYISRLPDFAEGVRAVLVDKDQSPHWRPSGLDGVDLVALRAVIEPAQTA